MATARTALDGRSLALQALLRGGSQGVLDAILRGDAGTAHPPDAGDGREHALATQLTYGVVKMRRALEWSLSPYLRKPLAELDPALRSVLLLGAYQLLYLKKIPAHSAVDESVGLARRHGHAGTAAFANAVLRKLAAQPARPPPPQDAADLKGFADFASVPEWLARHWIDRFGFADALRVAQGVNGPARRALRINLTRVDKAALVAELSTQHLVLADSRYGIRECLIIDPSAGHARKLSSSLRLGLVTVQSEESQLAAHVLRPGADDIVIDVCAGRGVKAGALAERASAPDRSLFALDDDAAKLALLVAEMRRLRRPLPVTVHWDAQRPYPPAIPANADAVLVDAPCSGIGTVGRHAELRWEKQASDPARLGATQLRILAQASQAVRPAGRLLYTVCSTAPEECETVVDSFLRSTRDWHAQPIDTATAPQDARRLGDFLLTLPGVDGADGFFYALLRKRPL
ncbi:MAG: hypothetical protein M3Z37_04035 [Candidatus Eremiobacteraeota bacterium]|nr:hypothetical protein [Candidatus Eremiobacteraeota bacterium]